MTRYRIAKHRRWGLWCVETPYDGLAMFQSQPAALAWVAVDIRRRGRAAERARGVVQSDALEE